MPIISAHENQHHICQYIYICIWSTWPKAHSKNQTQINCNWTQINCNSFYSIFPFAISFANLSRCRVFLSRHPCVWNSLSRAFAENMWHKFPVFRSEVRIETFNSKHNGHRFAAVITVATCGLILHLVASSSFTSSSSTPPSNASSRSQWALPDLNRERQISVGTAGPQLRPRISVGTARHHKRQISVGTATPLSNGGGPSQLVRAFADLSRSFREAFADFGSHLSKFVNNVSVWIQIHLRKLSTNILKTRILSLESLFRELSRKEIFANAFADLSRTWF